MNCKTEENKKTRFEPTKNTLKSDILSYIKTTISYALFFFVWVVIAEAIDSSSAGRTSLIEQLLALVSPDPLRILIGMYAITVGLWVLLGGRSNYSCISNNSSGIRTQSPIKKRVQATLLFLTNVLSSAANFSKDTTAIFLGLLIAIITILTIEDSSKVIILILSVTLSVVFFLIYGFLDFLAKKLLKSCKIGIIPAGDILAGMILISLSFPILFL